ncbi:MAG: M20/M25/M40 family metallo-hydrolase [Burkholderiales bacterium]|nr:M20/M25/M40 family metallo-hydrolase [Burkholderiales bacterium]
MFTSKQKLGLLAVSLSISLLACSSTARESFPMQSFISDLREVVNIDTKTGYLPGVNKVIDIMAKRLSSEGWYVTKYNCDGKGDILLATNKKNPDEFDIVLSAHADTVQVVGNAKKYPLTVDKKNIAHGAGVSDAKASLTAVWWIAKGIPKEIKDLLSIGIVVNPAEEDGSDCVTAKLMEIGQKSKRVLVYEPGGPKNVAVKARRGVIDLYFEFHGRTAHAGASGYGRNALEAMAIAIPQIKAVGDKYPHVSLNADMAESGTAINVIPDYASLKVDFRFNDHASRDAVLKEVQELCDGGFAKDIKCTLHYRNSYVLSVTPQSEELIELIDEASKELKQPKIRWVSSGGSSDANKYSAAGAAAVCSMGVIGGGSHHPTGEWADLKSAQPRIELAKKVMELVAREKVNQNTEEVQPLPET